MSKLKAIIFDMDGTIADTEEMHRQAFNLAFRELDYPLNWSRSEYKQLLSISGGKERIHHCLQSLHPAGATEDELSRATAAIHQRKSDLYRQQLALGNLGLRPGIRRLVGECRRAGLQLAIATSSSRKNVDTLLHGTFGAGADQLFSAIVTSDVVADKKPSPAVFHYTLSELGLGPENCIALEDTKNGNLAALAAGIKTIITTHPLTVDDDFAGASLVINHLGEPDNPFRRTAGAAYGRHYVDMALLQLIHSPSFKVGQPPHGLAKVAQNR